MKKPLLMAVLMLPLALAGCSHPAPYYPPPPPPAYSPIFHQGFSDGVDAANRDVRAGRPPDFARHPRFRRPPVPPPAWEDFRAGFRAGYEQVAHPGPPPPPRY
jgi:hypothetical protein